MHLLYLHNLCSSTKTKQNKNTFLFCFVFLSFGSAPVFIGDFLRISCIQWGTCVSHCLSPSLSTPLCLENMFLILWNGACVSTLPAPQEIQPLLIIKKDLVISLGREFRTSAVHSGADLVSQGHGTWAAKASSKGFGCVENTQQERTGKATVGYETARMAAWPVPGALLTFCVGTVLLMLHGGMEVWGTCCWRPLSCSVPQPKLLFLLRGE